MYPRDVCVVPQTVGNRLEEWVIGHLKLQPRSWKFKCEVLHLGLHAAVVQAEGPPR